LSFWVEQGKNAMELRSEEKILDVFACAIASEAKIYTDYRILNLILRQFDVIERIHPRTAYTVSLKKSEEKRLDVFARAHALRMAQAQAELLVAADLEVRSSFQALIDVLISLSSKNNVIYTSSNRPLSWI
jgi:hypothetical protein